MAGSISTERRLSYVAGYLELGLLAEARAELRQVAADEQDYGEVQLAWLEWALAAKRWPGLVRRARRLTLTHPSIRRGWILWAYALRELNRVAEARTALKTAEREQRIDLAILHYNLACYEALLGDAAEAERRLRLAWQLNTDCLEDAKTDPDLVLIREALPRIPLE